MHQDELEGIKKSVIREFKKGEKPGFIRIGSNHFSRLYSSVPSSETRGKFYKAMHSYVAKENIPILQELVNLRAEEASILGFPSYSSYVLRKTIAKDP